MNKKLKLTDREWKEFKIKDLFSIRIGDSLDGNKVDRTGLVAYVTRKESNNGVDGFISNDIERMWSDVPAITIGNETAKPFVQRYPFFTGTKVNILSPKIKCSYYALMFISVSLEQHKSKYSYSYTINSTRLKEQVVLLPVQADGTPDWEFMEAYMKQVEDELLSEVLPKLEAKLLEHIITLGALEDREWREFQFKDVFTRIQRGKRLKKDDHIEGTTPYVSSTATNNGIDGFVGNKERVRIFSNCISLANSGSVGFSFYHPYEALFSDDVKRVRWKNENANNKYTLLYLSTSIAQQRSKYAYGYKFNAQRMKRQIIMLPSQADGTPDYAYMEQTMRVMEYDALMTYLSSISV